MGNNGWNKYQSVYSWKSSDGIFFNSTGTIAATGTGSNHYQYLDCPGIINQVFYRLKIIDKTNSFIYISIIRIDNKQQNTVSIQPNPVKDRVFIFSGDMRLVNTFVKVMDTEGRLVIHEKITSFPHSINCSKLQSGIYYVNFKDGKIVSFMKDWFGIYQLTVCRNS